MLSRQVATTIDPDDGGQAPAIENGLHIERDMARQAATEAVTETFVHPQEPQHDIPTEHDIPRQWATEAVPPVTEPPVPPQEPRHEAATGHDMSRHDAATQDDTPRQAATEPAATGEASRYVAQLEHQLEIARDERDFLREQINRKDRTIEALIERDRETNFLVRGLQEMLTPLLPNRRQAEPPTHTP